MNLVNRTVVVVKARSPYVEWANSFDGPTLTLEEQSAQGTAFLVPEFEVEEDTQAFIRDNYLLMFEHELEAWMCEESTWPADRSYEVFRQWFDVEIHDMVVDLADDELVVDQV